MLFATLVDALEESLAVMKRVGDTVNCSANASIPCKYRWLQENDSICPVSCNQVLTTVTPGEYSCEAICNMKDNNCAFIALRLSVIKDETSGKQMFCCKTDPQSMATGLAPITTYAHVSCGWMLCKTWAKSTNWSLAYSTHETHPQLTFHSL